MVRAGLSSRLGPGTLPFPVCHHPDTAVQGKRRGEVRVPALPRPDVDDARRHQAEPGEEPLDVAEPAGYRRGRRGLVDLLRGKAPLRVRVVARDM